uniref:Protein FAR1-RELATED SEQUENCE n=1 Tax=Lactuca sativa TaxID=4236 RepID=A0A9R1V2P0_LACSA|nr:hypothetical protein LSAT_V11C700378030 [Lactuca sativa]
MQPRVIVTDRELALVNACQQVFLYATCSLCLWHITKNIRKHCKTLIPSKAEWKSFRAMWSILVDSPTWTSIPDVLQYLDDVWLNKYNQMFVSVWIDKHLGFGHSASSRVEGQHSATYKKKNYSLAKIVGVIDRFVKSQLIAINESFEKSMTVSKQENKFLCFDILRGNVSLKALDMLVEELQRLTLQTVVVNYKIVVPYHVLASYQRTWTPMGECIPLESIDLKISPSIPMENEDICGDGKFEVFKKTYNKQPKATNKSMMRKLVDIF